VAGPFALDGYDVLAPLGSTGRSWRAVCLADGRRVVLRRWVGAAARVGDARRRAALWGSVAGGDVAAGGGVVAVRDVLVVGDDLVVVSDLVEGGGLEALLARRESLSSGQVVTLVVPLAQTLAVAHARGLAHGRISMGAVVLDGDGRPMLTDWALAGDGEASMDVAALSAMALQCLVADAPTAVGSVLRAAVDARALAHDLLTAVVAESLVVEPAPVVDGAATADEPVTPPRGLVGAVVLVAAAVALAVGGGVLWGRHDTSAGGAMLPRRSTTATPTPASTREGVDWTAVVRALERRRVQALADVDRARLAAVEVRGTTLWRHDAREVSRLHDAHAHLRGLRVDVRSVHAQVVQRARVVVRVVDTLSSYDVARDDGTVLAHHAARGARAVDLVLTPKSSRWLLYSASAPDRPLGATAVSR
jgi:hypothetical protein